MTIAEHVLEDLEELKYNRTATKLNVSHFYVNLSKGRIYYTDKPIRNDLTLNNNKSKETLLFSTFTMHRQFV
jgi:hypothetical protein